MTNAQLKCLRCGEEMDLGYLADGGHGVNSEVAKWVADAPVIGWWGVKTKGHQQIPLSAYRCAQCGFVEFRAIATTDV